ncbi:alpha/beta fold hydrolase [Paenibacillus whitsoniae]|uniref:Alpha/beta fold hydrolase n=1 Tax=Paenibacillus whitsoniae TaxID=2496558 RepID=A0A430JHL9_9BACL|nr:alpha/beta fold hydrolase [Paenibacillus whitsoniae]RTE10551.1 alpha/beta fold hydrolase [Paenibacillus whitsoniae]
MWSFSVKRLLTLAVMLLVLVLTVPVCGAERQQDRQLQQSIPFWPAGQMPRMSPVPEKSDRTSTQAEPSFTPFLIPYLLDNSIQPKGAVLLAVDSGAEELARSYNKDGYQAFVVNYRPVANAGVEAQLDFQRAVRYVRYHAASFRIPDDRIITVGQGAAGTVVLQQSNQMYGYIQPTKFIAVYASDEIDAVSADANAIIALDTGMADDFANPGFPATYLAYSSKDAAASKGFGFAERAAENAIAVDVHLEEGGAQQALPTEWLEQVLARKAPSYLDIDQSVAKGAIDQLVAYGGLMHNAERLFYPEKKITVAEFTSMLVRTMQIKVEMNSAGAWYAPFMQAAEKAHLLKGIAEAGGEDDLTVETAKVMLQNARDDLGQQKDMTRDLLSARTAISRGGAAQLIATLLEGEEETYTASFSPAATVANNDLNVGFLATIKSAAQTDTLTLRQDGTYTLVKTMQSAHDETDRFNVHIAYTFEGNFEKSGGKVMLMAPASAAAQEDWGQLAAAGRVKNRTTTSQNDPSILRWFTGAFFSASSEHADMEVVIDALRKSVAFPGEVLHPEYAGILQDSYPNYNFTESAVTFSHGNITLRAAVFVPQGVPGKMPVVILSHGTGGGIDSERGIIQDLSAKGFVSFVFEFAGSGSGRSTGLQSTEMSILTEKKDLMAAIEYVQTLSYVDTDHIFLLGSSQGGAVTAITAPEYGTKIKGIILQYPAFNIVQNTEGVSQFAERTVLGGIPLGKVYNTDAQSILLQFGNVYNYVKQYKGPVLIMHGESDPTVDVSYSQEAAHAYEHAELFIYKGVEHGFAGDVLKQTNLRAIQFIWEHVKR